MPLNLHVAQITDLHLSPRPLSNGIVLQDDTEALLTGAVTALSARPDLDAVLVTGDLIDNGTADELDAAITALNRLPVPWYAIPGNHDVAFPLGSGKLDRQGFYARLQAGVPDGATIYAGAPERGSWTTLLKAGVRLVGLDSNVPGDWFGRVDGEQLAWLEATLDAAAEPLVVLLVHHPLHAVFGGWQEPTFHNQAWHKFFCYNGFEVLSILDRHPRVQLVLTGHVHLSQVARQGVRLHMSTAALSSYPLAYRVIHGAGEDGRWTCAWHTASPATPEQRAEALALLEASGLAHSYDPAHPEHFAYVSEGLGRDQEGSDELPLHDPDATT